jgi:hypothetical protein
VSHFSIIQAKVFAFLLSEWPFARTFLIWRQLFNPVRPWVNEDGMPNNSPTVSSMTPLKSLFKLSPIPLWLWAVGLTALFAGSLGMGFGLALRLNRPQQAGSSLWHSDQSFPSRPDSVPAAPPETVEP